MSHLAYFLQREPGMNQVKGRPALVLVDVINGFDFEGSEGLVAQAEQAAPCIFELAKRARSSDVPVVYVNDNFGMWQSDFRAVTETCLAADQPGHGVTKQLLPERDDYFVLKPRHSGFLATPLEQLLLHLDVTTLVLAGFSTDLCVLSTALDAHARGFHLVVPFDCTAANEVKSHRRTLDLLSESLGVSTAAGSELDFRELLQPRRSLF